MVRTDGKVFAFLHRTYVYICRWSSHQRVPVIYRLSFILGEFPLILLSVDILFCSTLSSLVPFALLLATPSMRLQQNVAAYFLIHVAIARAFFQQCSSVLRRQRGAGPTIGIPPTMMSSQFGLSWRRVPLGLGSWRVESVVDSQEEPDCMFVFLFDDGSGERD